MGKKAIEMPINLFESKWPVTEFEKHDKIKYFGNAGGDYYTWQNLDPGQAKFNSDQSLLTNSQNGDPVDKRLFFAADEMSGIFFARISPQLKII